MLVALSLWGSPFHFGVSSQPVVTRVVAGASQRLAWKKMSIQPVDVVNHHEWYCERNVGRDSPLARWGHRGEYAGPDAGSGIHDHEGR